tara:strand:- start:1187 stop:3106 length:1920 start_codon:yes stop_codon:yes gene_type:complete
MQENNKTKFFIRGGQITLHNIRMFSQVIKVVLAISLASLILLNVLWYMNINTSYQKYLFNSLLTAKAKLIFDDKAVQDFKSPDDRVYQVLSKNVLKAKAVNDAALVIFDNAAKGFFLSIILYFVISTIAIYLIRKKGKTLTQDQLLNEHSLASLKEYKKIVKKQKTMSDLILGGAPLIKESETKHLFLHGSTGSGKSTCIKELLQKIIDRGDKFIVLDKSCDLTKTFYQEDKHLILNPFDKRSKAWNVWCDARTQADFDSIAEALMPMPKGSSDPFWVNAARTIFTSTAFKMRDDVNKSNITLLRNLLTADLEKMEDFLKDTEAATLVSEKIEKTAVSIKSVLATYLKSLKYLSNDKNVLSIRDWVADPSSKGLFITSLADKHATLRPLISMWLDIAINATMSLTPDRQRRIWLILDEAHSLHRLPCLFDGANEVRKFGGCILLGTTSYAGICDIYGKDGARGILDQFNTSIYFRTPRAETASWVSKELGESEIEEMHENISYGANTMRDGISLSKHRTRRPAVPYTDIQKLNDLEAYLRVSGNYPIVKVKFKIFQSNNDVEGFIESDINEDVFKDISKLEETYIQNPNSAPEFKQNSSKKAKDKKNKENIGVKDNEFNKDKKGSSNRNNIIAEDMELI